MAEGGGVVVRAAADMDSGDMSEEGDTAGESGEADEVVDEEAVVLVEAGVDIGEWVKKLVMAKKY